VAVAPFLLAAEVTLTTRNVISTEAAHSIIVSSAAEKSASLPPPFATPHRAFVLVFTVGFERESGLIPASKGHCH
jgi:hypothetical protein